MTKIYPVYVIPDSSYGKRAKERFSHLCERVEGDAASCVINAHVTIAKLWSPEAHIYDVPEWDKDYRLKVREGLDGVDDIVDKITDQIWKFKTALPAMGKEGDSQHIENAQTYCTHAKEVIERFKALPFYEELFRSNSRF
ncbi:MAG: hypothetical protein HY363_02390 [Candidatus Aenigmarchaeota archaeon]|nr:hypothetical protein [Candidatus Aenigmarchaeota archaeon]